MPGKKLLVADDSLTIQKVIRLALSNEGYEIQAVSDGNDALQQISLFRPDVVLVDVSLPGQSAFELKRAANGHDDLAATRFVLMSSAFEKVDEEQADEVVFHGRLTKPFDPAHLRQVIQDVLATMPEVPKAGPAMIPPPMPPAPPKAKSGSSSFNFSALPLETPPPPPDWEAPEEMESAEDLPIMAPPPPENVSELWEQPGAGNAVEDIKNLTESTIRMSGLDDFQWSVKEPSLKPLPSMTDTGGSTFVVEPPMEFMGSDFARDSGSSSMNVMDQIVGIEIPSMGSGAEAHSPVAPFGSAPPSMASIDPVELKQLIEKQIQEKLQQLLPEIAERVIRAEIHRILSDMN